jgi:hypothetical protein
MFFDKCRNLVELKAEYKRLAMKHHPDMGGDVEIMKAVNAEYDAAFERLKRYPMDSEEPTKTHQNSAEVAEDFKKVIDALIRIKGIEIELCGSWLWIGGDTYPVREELKAAGCRWQKDKRKWYWHPPEKHVGYSKRRASMSYIRSKYGSQLIKGKDEERVALTA